MSKKFPVYNKISLTPIPPNENPFQPLQVEIGGSDDYSFHAALGRFKKLVANEKIIGRLKEKREYEKPSDRKRRKRREAQRRLISLKRKDSEPFRKKDSSDEL